MVVCLLSTYYGQAECWPHTRVTASVSTDPAGRTGGAEARWRDTAHPGEPDLSSGLSHGHTSLCAPPSRTPVRPLCPSSASRVPTGNHPLGPKDDVRVS